MSDIRTKAVNTKKYKHIEDVIEDYLLVQQESLDLPARLDELQDKLRKHALDKPEFENYSIDEAQDLFKLFVQQQKTIERLQDLDNDFSELQKLLVYFLGLINGKIEYVRKEEQGKFTYLFWLENGELRSNR